MKKLTFAIAIFALAFSAHATKPGNNGGGNGGCGVGQQTNGCGTTPSTPATGSTTNAPVANGGQGGTGIGVGLGIGSAESSAKASSTSGAISGSKSSSEAAGGSVGNVGVETGNTYVAPAPVFTVVPHSNGGIVTKSHAVSLGWSLLSWSKSEQQMDPFVAGERLAADLERNCQFESASMLRQHMAALTFPSYRELPAQPGVRNHTPAECQALRASK